jgi:hypothetical protein
MFQVLMQMPQATLAAINPARQCGNLVSKITKPFINYSKIVTELREALFQFVTASSW